MIKSIKALLNIKDSDSFEFRFMSVVTFISILIGCISTFFNYLLDLAASVTFYSAFASILFFIQFLFIRRKWKYKLMKWIYFISVFIILDILWIEQGGLSGSITFLYIILLTSILLIWQGIHQIIIGTIFFINIALLIIIDCYYPEIISDYETTEHAFLDKAVSFVLTTIGIATLNLVAKKYYKQEKQRANNAERLKTEFLANVSHELRTPMNSIIGFSQLLSPDNIEDNEEFIKIINQNGESLLRLVNDIIDIAKIESNQIDFQYIDFKAYQILEELKMNFDILLNQDEISKLKIIIDKNEPDKLIFGDQTRINQVLSNLLNNAIKFTSCGTINIGFYTKNEKITYYVKDSGIGIPEEKQSIIFDRFIKLENNNSSSLYRGTGIGLSICKQLVTLMGGEIWVKSKVGAGSTFLIQLPLKSQPLEKCISSNKIIEKAY